jgi:hypothetical protein
MYVQENAIRNIFSKHIFSELKIELFIIINVCKKVIADIQHEQVLLTSRRISS